MGEFDGVRTDGLDIRTGLYAYGYGNYYYNYERPRMDRLGKASNAEAPSSSLSYQHLAASQFLGQLPSLVQVGREFLFCN